MGEGSDQSPGDDDPPQVDDSAPTNSYPTSTVKLHLLPWLSPSVHVFITCSLASKVSHVIPKKNVVNCN